MHVRARLGPNGQVSLSYEHRAELGGGVRLAMAGTINGTPFRTTSFRMGDFTGIAIRKEVQVAAGVSPGDEVDLEIRLDTAPRTVDPPPALAAALAEDALAQAAFSAMSYTHQRECAEWVAAAKKGDIRDRRVAKALELLHTGQAPGQRPRKRPA